MFLILKNHLHNIKDWSKSSKMPRLSIHQPERIVNSYIPAKFRKWERKMESFERRGCKWKDFYLRARNKKVDEWMVWDLNWDLPKSNVLAKIRITDLKRIDRAVYRNRSLTSRKLKNLLNLEMSHRSIRRYLNALGWKKIRS